MADDKSVYTEPIAKTEDGRDIYVQDVVKEISGSKRRYLTVLRLDPTSDPARPSLLCFGGSPPRDNRKSGPGTRKHIAEFVTVYADQVRYELSIRETKTLRKRRAEGL